MNGSRILVASRRPDQRAELRAALEFEGYDVDDVTTAAQVENACAEHYDVLVMDLIAIRRLSRLFLQRTDF
jgi:DNA-binding response OmpR family regulator